MSFPGFIILIYYVHSFEIFELEVHFMRPVLVAKNRGAYANSLIGKGALFVCLFIYFRFIYR